jgi:hypothetical protein
MTKGGTAINELEALVLRLREKGALQISVTKGDTSVTATFAPVMRPTDLPEAEENRDTKTPTERVKDEQDDLAYWSSTN